MVVKYVKRNRLNDQYLHSTVIFVIIEAYLTRSSLDSHCGGESMGKLRTKLRETGKQLTKLLPLDSLECLNGKEAASFKMNKNIFFTHLLPFS